MKLLLTGATGFIGTNLQSRLQKDGHDVMTLGRSFNNNAQEITAFMTKEKFDGVIHLASLFLAQHKPEDIKNLIESNVLFPTTVLESAVAAKIPWFINTGTFWQHFKNKKYSPVNLYAATKQAFEDIAQYYIESSSINFVTIKLFNVFGPKDPRPKVFNLWLKISQTKETLEMSPGEQIMDITYIDNVIEGYVKMIYLLSKDSKRKLAGKSFAIPSKERMSLKKLATVFEKVTGVKLSIKWGVKGYRPREVMIPWKKGVKIPGWKQVVTLEEGIKRTFNEK
jgi:CDP-paratose synthetase